MDRMGIALLWVSGIMLSVFFTVLVVGNDSGSATEVALLEGVPVEATLGECDAMYHAISKVKAEPSHSTLISIANDIGCPFEYPLEWTP